MSVAPQDRPLESLRDEAVDQLIMNYGHGKLSREAFERRLDTALDAKSHDELLELTRDLDLTADRDYATRKKTELGIRVEPAAVDAEEVEHMINVFGGTTRAGTWDVPREIRMINVFGGSELDFSNARFSAKTTRITLFCLFGGASFYVREGIRTVSKAICIFGGVDNRAPSTADSDAPTILIEGLALFGGAHIRVKKTARERLQEFASTLRAMFDSAGPPRT